MLKWVYSNCKETIARLSGRQKKYISRESQWEEEREKGIKKDREVGRGSERDNPRDAQGSAKKEGMFR